MYDDAPRPLPTRVSCLRCGASTPTLADRMRHDEAHALSFEQEDA